MLVTSAYVYLNRDLPNSQQSTDQAKNSQKRPKILIQDFEILRYDAHHLVMRLTADKGSFEQDDQVFLENEVKLSRIDWESGESQNLFSDRGVVVLKAKPFTEMVKGAEVELAKLEQNVRVVMKKHTLFTEKATYDPNGDVVFGELPVRVVGPHRVFDGARGFRYNFQTELLEVFGRVTGKESQVDF
jgi:hypothetical protein